MLAMQASIGAVNDLADEPLDRVEKPAKPIVAGLLSRRTARIWAVATGVVTLILALPFGPGAPAAPGGPIPPAELGDSFELGDLAVAGVALACLGLGYLYDLRLSRTALSWLPLALALPLLPIFAWLGATGNVPAGLLALLPAAALAGGGLIVGNGLVDLERDERAGRPTAAVRFGRQRAWLGHTVALGIATTMAILLAPGAAGSAVDPRGGEMVDLVRSFGVPLGAVVIAVGAALLQARAPTARERGWELEAIGTAVVGLAWLAGTALTAGGGGTALAAVAVRGS
jgi:4-hydroxybenzoate polyprenyltransferase